MVKIIISDRLLNPSKALKALEEQIRLVENNFSTCVAIGPAQITYDHDGYAYAYITLCIKL